MNRTRTRTLAAACAALALVTAAAATPALAAKGGGSTSTTTNTLWLASVNGWSTGAKSAAAAPETPTVPYGATVTFGSTVEPLAGWEYAMISLACFQDVNGDGKVDTTLSGPDIVFSWLDRPAASYTLGGNSIWSMRGGGAAVCQADLDAYGVKGGKQTIRVLRSLPLSVTA